MRNGSSREQELRKLDVLAVRYGIPEWGRSEVWFAEGFLVDIQTGVEQDFYRFETIGEP